MPRKAQPQPPSGLDHDLSRHFPELCRFNSTRRMRSSKLYRQIEPEVRRILDTVVSESFSNGFAPQRAERVRSTAWNIERGNRLDEIIRTLQEHSDIRHSDLFLITELDHGMARSENRMVAREIAQALDLDYVFVPCYISLVKGSGLEYHVEGENTLALHGNALFSRHPLRDAHLIALPPGKDMMRGKEKRLGYQQAAVATVDHPSGPFYAVSLHLDAHSTQRHRFKQMKLVLDHVDRLQPRLPVLIGGDWNTTTFNAKRATYSILGYARRVLMGVRNVVDNHYPHPDRWFERHLFRELHRRGYRYHELNQPGGCTFHYDVDDLALNTNMADWVPGWCFWFINWAVTRVGGQCSLKLDWFAGRDLAPAPGHQPRVLSEVHERKDPLSDHDPILVDVVLEKRG